jgi:gliding motility-associated-like protein
LKLHYSILKFLFVFFICSSSFAQGEANIWYFGNKAGLDFSSGNPVMLNNGQLNTVEGCTSLSDASGNLVMYTNGVTAWNKNHVVMANGTGLFGDISSSQSSVIVQKPGSSNIFYIFTTSSFGENTGFHYSQVDMSANGGLGEVVSKNTELSTSTCEKIAVIRHSNGQYIWVITHLLGSDTFFAHLVSASGISPIQVTSHAGCIVPPGDDNANAIGYMKISADGKKIVTCHTFLTKSELFDFDTTTGHVSNGQDLGLDGLHAYGAEFSPDSNVLYVATVDERKLFQFNLNAELVADSKILISTLPQSLGALQMAPNGKIYIAMAEIDKLSVINNPNKIGMGCDLSTNAVDLNGRMCLLGLPNFNQSVFYSKLSAEGLCAGNSTAFSFESTYTSQSVSWNFGDATLSNETSPSHQYSAAGTYTITVTANYASGPMTRTKEITISAVPATIQIAEQTFCITENENYQLSSNTVALLNGQAASDFEVSYFATLADAQNQANVLADTYALQPGSITIYAFIKSLQPEGCGAVAQFVLTCFATPIDTHPTDMKTCDGIVRDGIATFDLDSKTDEILNGQPETGYAVKYYADQNDAENDIGPITGLYTNAFSNQAVYARVSNSNGCYKIVSLNLIVEQCNNEEDDSAFPKFFTPNGDGYNDVWETKAINGSSDMKINIFNRFGKLIKTITQNDSQWDGRLGGIDLPSDDYWYVVSGQNIREFKGHFALKR